MTPPVVTPTQGDREAAEYPYRRSAYEGEGGWKDGRFGQAYDLIFDALKARGEPLGHRHPLLTQIELVSVEEPDADA